MINNITKYFAGSPAINSKGPLSQVSNVKLQYQKLATINSILTTFFRKFYILISKPIYTITPNGIKISVLYFSPKASKKYARRPKAHKFSKTSTESNSSKIVQLQKVYWDKFSQNLPVIAKNLNSNGSDPSLIVNEGVLTGLSSVRSEGTKEFSRSRLTFLVLLLSKMLRTNVQLELVRLKYVYHDSNILAQFLGINSHRSTYGQFKNLLWRRVSTNNTMAVNQSTGTYNNILDTDGTLPPGPNDNANANSINTDDASPVTQLTGFKIKISGRLAKQRVVPKKTVKTTYKGAISPNKYNLVEQATFTGKNKKGAYSIRVWTSHGTTSHIPLK